MTKPEKLAELGRWVLQVVMEDSGYDLNYDDVLDKAKVLNLFREEPYAPAKHGEAYDAEPGDTIYVEVEE